MTLYEKGKELGIKDAPTRPGSLMLCPHAYEELNATVDTSFCYGRDEPRCAECWGREYVAPESRTVVKDTNGGEWRQDPDKQGWTYQEPLEPVETEAMRNLVAESLRHFSTGAVRDDATGKGRYDLLPWGSIHALAQHCERGAIHYGERNIDKGIPQHSLIDSGVRHLSLYIQGDAEPHHLVAALWNIAWAVEQELKRPELIDLPERTEASGQAT